MSLGSGEGSGEDGAEGAIGGDAALHGLRGTPELFIRGCVERT